jgi:hypothetical protein
MAEMPDSNKSQLNARYIQLCGVQGCCPVVAIHDDLDQIIITDDFGGKVTLTKEQWREALIKVQV